MLILATLAFTAWGFIWYATLFDDLWQQMISQTENDLILLAQERGIYQSIMTYLISFIQVLGLHILQKASKSKTFIQFQVKALVVSAFICCPTLGNEVLFAGSSPKLWIFDCLHFILGYAGIATIFWIWNHFVSLSRPSE